MPLWHFTIEAAIANLNSNVVTQKRPTVDFVEPNVSYTWNPHVDPLDPL